MTVLMLIINFSARRIKKYINLQRYMHFICKNYLENINTIFDISLFNIYIYKVYKAISYKRFGIIKVCCISIHLTIIPLTSTFKWYCVCYFSYVIVTHYKNKMWYNNMIFSTNFTDLVMFFHIHITYPKFNNAHLGSLVWYLTQCISLFCDFLCCQIWYSFIHFKETSIFIFFNTTFDYGYQGGTKFMYLILSVYSYK